MDILSFILGYIKGKSQGGGNVNGDIDAINDRLDVILGEVIGENKYTVTFIGADGSTLHTETVIERDDCRDPANIGLIPEPTKESTKYYSYTFNGWSLVNGGVADENVLKKITSDITVYAAFVEKKIYLASGYIGDYFYDSAWDRLEKDGTNVSWKIDPDYTLFLTGSGEMSDNIESDGRITDREYGSGFLTTWHNYRNKITSVQIEYGITNIGRYAFAEMPNLQSVSIPNSVIKIDAWAFENCTALTDVILPTKLKSILGLAFKGCTSITSIIIPASVNWIAQEAFNGSGITNATFQHTTGWKLFDTKSDTIIAEYTSEEMCDTTLMASVITGLYNKQLRNYELREW